MTTLKIKGRLKTAAKITQKTIETKKKPSPFL